MTKRQNIIATVGLAMACVVAYKAAYLKTDKPALSVVPVKTALTKDDQAMPASTALPSPTVLKAQPVDALPPIGEPPVAELAKGDGKDVVDGKEVIDAKEVLPPVGQLLPPGHNMAVDPAVNGPAMEHVGKAKAGDPPGDPPSADPKGDPLLADPNVQNTSGPVVSQETR